MTQKFELDKAVERIINTAVTTQNEDHRRYFVREYLELYIKQVHEQHSEVEEIKRLRLWIESAKKHLGKAGAYWSNGRVAFAETVDGKPVYTMDPATLSPGSLQSALMEAFNCECDLDDALSGSFFESE